MAANKHTPTQLEEVKAKVAKLDRMGWTQWRIAREVGVSQPQVSMYLKSIREEYQERRFHDRDAKVNEVLAALRDVREEAYEALLRSKEDARRRTKETLKPGKPPKARKGERPPRGGTGYTKVIEQLEGRLARGEYLTVILMTWQQERELLGLDEPKKVDQKNLNVNFDWEALARAGRERRGPGGARADPVAERLRAEHERLNGAGGDNGHANGAQTDEGS